MNNPADLPPRPRARRTAARGVGSGFPRDLPTETLSHAVAAARLNRSRVAKALAGIPAVLFGREETVRSNDNHYPFRQYSDFLFLTAYDLPQARLLLEGARATLFVPVADAKRRVWLGDLESPREVAERLGIDRVLPLDRFDREMRRLASKKRPVAADGGIRAVLHKSAPGLKFTAGLLTAALRECRALKTEPELELIRAASRAGDDAMTRLIEMARPGMGEYELTAAFAYRLALSRMGPSFPTIVAGGVNAAVLHYVDSRCRMRSGDLVLVDAGAECRGYACDISRTFPVSGRFTRRQQPLYEAVLAAQLETAAALVPGSTLEAANRAARMPIASALAKLGILRCTAEDAVESKAIDLFFPHGVSHDLGLDVHDRSPLPPGVKPDDRGRCAKHPLEAGRVLTVEPGVYFMKPLLTDPERRKKFAKQVDFAKAAAWLDFGGIRVEDDVVVREGGVEWLTHAPKTPEALSRLTKKA